jgi:hypothetical protein
MVVVKLQQFTECESRGYDVRYCDITEQFEMMALYWGAQDTQGEKFVHFTVASRHVRSKLLGFISFSG